MLRRRLSASVLLACATALAVVALGPATAALAADTITVTSAGSPQTDPGLLTIDVQSTTLLTSLTAQLVPAQGSPVDVTNLQEISVSAGSPYASEWQVPSDLALPALGSYQIDVTAADTGGGTLTSFNAGTLYYAIQPTITMSTSPNPVDYDHQTVTFSGTLTGTYPDGTTGPVANQEVDIFEQYSTTPFLTTTTGSDGTYQVAGVPVPYHSYAAVVPSSDTIFSGSSAFIEIHSNRDPVNLTAQVSATHVKYKQSVTITGTATYLPAGGSVYQPLAGRKIRLVNGDLPVKSTTTAPDGTYSMSLQMLESSATNELAVEAGGTSLLTLAKVALPAITVALPVDINSLTAKVDAFGRLTVHGCMYITYLGGREVKSLPLSVEYSAHSNGPWTLLGTVRPSFSYSCPNASGGRFTGRFQVKLAAAYYRVEWGGDANFQPAVSETAYAWRYLTKITSLGVSATHVARNSDLTVSGKLWQDNSGWHVYARRQVLIILRPKGSTKWYWIAKPYTNSTGHFTATFKDPVSATWSAVYEGDKTHYASGAKLIYVSASAALPGGLPGAAVPAPLGHLVHAKVSAYIANLGGLAPSAPAAMAGTRPAAHASTAGSGAPEVAGMPVRGAPGTGAMAPALAGDDATLSGVSCTSTTSCISAGFFYAAAEGGFWFGLSETLEGNSWGLQTVPGHSVNNPGEVSCGAPTNCMLVGDHYSVASSPRMMAESFGRGSWTVTQWTDPAGARLGWLGDVSCVGPTFCMAVGADSATTLSAQHLFAERWTGTQWQQLKTPAPAHARWSGLGGLSCVSVTDCMAVGSYENSAKKVLTFADSWNGHQWTITKTPDLTGKQHNIFDAVSCPTASRCVAVGYAYGPGQRQFAEKWSGGRWRLMSLPSRPGSFLAGVSCPTTSFCVATGGSGHTALAEMLSGGSWRALRTASLTGTRSAAGLLHVSCVSTTVCEAVGYRYNPKVRYSNNSLAEVWNGHGWKVQKTVNPT